MLNFESKARTLAQLEGRLSDARVLPQLRVDRASWQRRGDRILGDCPEGWIQQPVIVRSSAAAEDTAAQSLAGRFLSIPMVSGTGAIARAVETVFASYDGTAQDDEIFIQPMLDQVAVSGVAFTREPSTAADYYVINYDDVSGATDEVTSGRSNALKTIVVHRHARGLARMEPWVAGLVAALGELEGLFQHDALDVEFAVAADGRLYVLQVRPLVLSRTQPRIAARDQAAALAEIEALLRSRTAPHPYLFGHRSVFGVMPDWNPAEIIGTRPRPLALSLYRELVTDSIWAYQRNNYGYRNLRSFPLLLSLHGMPYIDVRVSLNSFIPEDVSPAIAEKLVNYYVDALLERPAAHDKIEFEIIFSCYTLDLPERLAALDGNGFDASEQASIADSLRRLTNAIVHPENGLWRRDLAKLARLEERQAELSGSDMPALDRVYWLIEDCKRYGTLPFAGLARAGFIAVQLLRSLVVTGVLSQAECQRFLASLETVSSAMTGAFETLDRDTFLDRFGHLRPGSYDIQVPRYDAAPERYFDWDAPRPPRRGARDDFQLTLPQLKALDRALKAHDIDHDVITFFDFIKAAIEGREHAKFVFTRSLSQALATIEAWGAQHGFDPATLSYLDYLDLKALYASATDPLAAVRGSIERGRSAYATTASLVLPPLIAHPDEVWCFETRGDEPNFVTLGTCEGPVVTDFEELAALRGAVVMLPAADPGYDWVFAHGIGALITQYGGVNSHMAIRAAELDIPAVIGCGQAFYAAWSEAAVLRVDCANRRVVRIR